MGLVAEGDIKVLIDEWEYTTSGWRMDRRKVVSVKLLRSGHLYECAPRQVLDHYGVHYEETQAH